MKDWLIIALSCCYVLIVLSAARLLRVDSLYARKLVHILVSLWIIPCFQIASPPLRLAGPLCFVALNYAFFRKQGKGSGLVFFPLSLVLLLSAESLGWLSEASVIGSVLIMGLGDGAAAVFGHALGHRKKSLAGFCVMFLVSLALFFFLTRSWLSFAAALMAAAVEYFTPGGYDNITVPLVSALLMEVLCAL